MRKEKILEILENAKDGNGAVPMRLVRTAFDKLPEPCEDTISRQAVIDALDCINGVEEVLRTLPPAQPKTGRWIYTPGMNEQCSACGQYFPLSYFKDRPFDIKYCPHCGADMRGERKK